MLRYLLKRVLLMVPLLFGISLILFELIQLAPGDPVALLVPEGQLDPEQRMRLIRALGLDRPAYEQYFVWLSNWVRGDWGFSFSNGAPVRDLIFRATPVTLQLQGLALVLALAVSIPIGILSAVKQHSWFDNTATVFSLFGISMPDFWFGLSLMMIFSVGLGWLPTTGMGDNLPPLARIPFFLMPVWVLTTQQLATFARFMRSSMLEVMTQNYIITARAKGLTERAILILHALKNALIPVVTIIGLSFVRLLGGSVIVESVFGWPGLGRLALNAVLDRDALLIMGITMMTAVWVLVVNLFTDIAYVFLDPRISLTGRRS